LANRAGGGPGAGGGFGAAAGTKEVLDPLDEDELDALGVVFLGARLGAFLLFFFRRGFVTVLVEVEEAEEAVADVALLLSALVAVRGEEERRMRKNTPLCRHTTIQLGVQTIQSNPRMHTRCHSQDRNNTDTHTHTHTQTHTGTYIQTDTPKQTYKHTCTQTHLHTYRKKKKQ
jgi:hypothetical protein